MCAVLTGYAVVQNAPVDWHPLAAVALGDVAATITVFVFSFAMNNTSVYDPYWSVAPVVIATWLAVGPGAARGFDLRQLVVVTVIAIYGARLTYNWARGWAGLSHEDWRYVAFRKQGRLYWVTSFFGLHLVPTIFVFLGCLPLHAALAGPSGFAALDVAGAVVTLLGTGIETVADEQLRTFRRNKQAEGAICAVGLWRWSRHPNYFGEIMVWVGLWLFGLAAGAPWWAAIGWLAMVALFVALSIPLAEKRSLERRPHYAEHQRKVSMLIPLPPKS